MNLTPEVQATILANLKEKVSLSVPIVFDTLYYFGGKEDFAATANIADGTTAYTKETEAQFAMIYLKGFRDDLTQITCDDPTTILDYRIFVFYEYVAVRVGSPTTNSRQDFVEALINLRSDFTGTQMIEEGISQHGAASVIEQITNNAETRYLKGIKGDYIELAVPVEVR